MNNNNDEQKQTREYYTKELDDELKSKNNENRIKYLKKLSLNTLVELHLVKKYGTTNENNINELKEIFSAYRSNNIFDCFMSIMSVNKILNKDIKKLKEAYKDLEEKIDDQNYIIEELGKSNNALLDGIEEIKKQKYDRILYSKIPGFGPGKYDKMKKYSNNIKYNNIIKAPINKKPLNQKRKRGSKLK